MAAAFAIWPNGSRGSACILFGRDIILEEEPSNRLPSRSKRVISRLGYLEVGEVVDGGQC